MLANIAPELCRERSARITSPPSVARAGVHGGDSAGEPYVRTSAAPRRCRDRQRLPSPRVESCRARLLRSSRNAELLRRSDDGSTFSDTSTMMPRMPSDPASDARDIVARDVLHHGAAERQDPTRAHRAASRPARNRARHPRWCRTRRGADRQDRQQCSRRPSRRSRNAAARRPASDPARPSACFDFGERRARARSDHEFGGFVGHDAAYARADRAPRRAACCRRNPWCRRHECTAAYGRGRGANALAQQLSSASSIRTAAARET